jgi:hypothetical protein
MKLKKLLTVMVLVLGLTAGAVTVVPAQTPSPPGWMTGDAAADFTAPWYDAHVYDGPTDLLPHPTFPVGKFSGWDVLAIYFYYDSGDDRMYVGIDCNGVCGDADGDGDPGAWTSPGGTGGTDNPDLNPLEGLAMAIDSDKDGTYDVAVGVSNMGDIDSFGTYDYPSAGFPYVFGAAKSNDTPLYGQPSAAWPDIEFSIGDFSDLVTLPCLEFRVKLFSGSFSDPGIAEDYVSGEVSIPCGLQVEKTCVVEPPSGGEGCTPGYWKQEQHFDSWVNYVPGDLYNVVFGVNYNKTLLEALETGGGGEKALGRHATAALLNAANPDVNYAYTEGQIIAMVQDAYGSGDYESTKNLFEAQNEAGCFIGDDANPAPPVPSSTCEIVSGGEVTYEYTVTNIGCPVSNVTVVDDKLGRIDATDPMAPGFALGTGNVVTFTKTVQILVTTTNVVTVTGYLEGGTKCQAIDEVTVTVEETPPGGGQGCTPGYWKQGQHFDSWVNYTPEGPDADWYDDVFSVPYYKTLLQALETGGGGEKALGRHATAALLNAANPDVNYAYTEAEIIDMVQDAYASGDYESTKNLFEAQNEAGCPLD